MSIVIRHFLLYAIRWVSVSVLVGVMTGSASALFLWLLNEVTGLRETYIWMVALLPAGGWIIGWMYYKYGSNVLRGNNQIIEEYRSPRNIIPLRMAPMILLGTLMTHLFGGSAGREGTAVQMGGALADQVTKWFGLSTEDRRIILLTGVSGGFASVFGTPWAGAVFALEVLMYKKYHYSAVFPVVLTALLADRVCHLYPIQHTSYAITEVPPVLPEFIGWSVLAGIIFGLTSMMFAGLTRQCDAIFKNRIYYPPLRPAIGGAILALVVFGTGMTRYLGLGVPVIEEAFQMPGNPFDFFLKMLFTSLTLGAGFKGGEVTPLFFIGATLGNALAGLIPLPMSFLAGMGMMGVFAGAVHAPLACTIMGIELFGTESAFYLFVACSTAYLSSGLRGIYSSQQGGRLKNDLYKWLSRR